MRYYNNDRLHSSNANMSPVQYELSQLNVSVNAWPEHPVIAGVIAIISTQQPR